MLPRIRTGCLIPKAGFGRVRAPSTPQKFRGRTHKKSRPEGRHCHSKRVAERTGLEPATSAVTGRHSNQLNYRSNR